MPSQLAFYVYYYRSEMSNLVVLLKLHRLCLLYPAVIMVALDVSCWALTPGPTRLCTLYFTNVHCVRTFGNLFGQRNALVG
jgi:hypothetical protein